MPLLRVGTEGEPPRPHPNPTTATSLVINNIMSTRRQEQVHRMKAYEEAEFRVAVDNAILLGWAPHCTSTLEL